MTQRENNRRVTSSSAAFAPDMRHSAPVFDGVVKYFPAALVAVANVSKVGNDQHNGPGSELRWDRGKSTDEGNALLSHLMKYAHGEQCDTDGTLHLAKVAWRALALLQKELEKIDAEQKAARWPER